MKSLLPAAVVKRLSASSRSRTRSNRWLQYHCKDVRGDVLSVGSGNDSDGAGGYYRDYFQGASSYTTSEVTGEFGCDLILDARSMPQIADESYDCIFCSGVLEHVDDFHSAFDEITRVLKTQGVLLLGLPFRQPIHMGSQDFWRFTEWGIKHLLKDAYTITEMAEIDPKKGAEFPAAYWFKATKLKSD